MKSLFLLAFLGLATAAPQNWPYRDSLMPYHRYGYPSQSQYKYLPQIEDDEDIGPYPAGVARQDFVVGSDGQSSAYVYRRPLFENKAWAPKWKIGERARPTTEATAPTVVETGSVAPVVEPSKEPPRTTVAPSPPPPKPVGPEQNVGKPVQPPPFPPARPPPTPAPKDEEEEDEDEEDDDESEEADDEEAEEQDNEETPEKDDEEEEEEERRRQEPLSDEKVDEPTGAVQNADVSGSSNSPVVEPVVQNNKSVSAEPASVEEVNAPPAVESSEVPDKPVEVEDESDEDQGVDDEVEALVPGYVTDQGEVLVPVDTVTGDQPISIVPDPYTPPRRGVPINGHASNFRYNSYNNPYYYSDVYEDELGRQESEESVEEGAEPKEQDGDDEDSNSNEGGPEGRNEYLTSFPPSRTPALYAVINSRFPVEEESYETEQSPSSQSNPFGPVIAYRVKQTQQRPSVSVAVALSGGTPSTSQSSQQQYVRNPMFPMYSQQIRNNPFIGQYIRNPYVNQPVRRNPNVGHYNPYAMFQKRYPTSPYVGQHMRNPYGGNYGPNPYVNRFVNRPAFNPYEYQGPYSPQEIRSPFYGAGPIGRPYYPGPSPFGGYGPRPGFRPPGFGYTQANPVFINRRPGIKPVAHNVGSNKVVVVSPKKPVAGKYSNKKPTPVVHQDDNPYLFENPEAFNTESNESNQSDFVQPLHDDPQPHKSRRAAKMAKKTTKKEKPVGKNKKVTTLDSDPLQILKKVTSKKA